MEPISSSSSDLSGDLMDTSTPFSDDIPSSPTEASLRTLWANVIGLLETDINVDDNFFLLGGNSVLAMKLAAAARRLGVPLTVEIMFKYPTIKEMASKLTGIYTHQYFEHAAGPESLSSSSEVVLDDVKSDIAALCNIPIASIEDVYAASAVQEGMVALSKSSSGTYILHFKFDIPDSIDIAQLQTAWTRVVENYPVLRTRFCETPTGLVQIVTSGMGVSWQVLDHPPLAKGSTIDNCEENSLESLNNFTVLLDSASKQKTLLWDVSHALLDGWCIPRLLRDVEDAYNNLPLLPAIPFRDFIQYTSNIGYPSDPKVFWHDQLDGSPSTDFPLLPIPQHQPLAQAILVEEFKLLGNTRSGITLSMIVRAAWAITVAQYSASDDIVFGTTLSGRNSGFPDIDELIGPTITTVPIRVSITKTETVSSFLERIKQQTINMMPFEQFGLQNIAGISAETRSACRFQNVLVVQPPQEEVIDDSNRSPWLIGTETTSFPHCLMMECFLKEDSVKLQATFDDEVIYHVQMQRVMRHFAHLINELQLRDWESTLLSDIETISTSDMQELHEWNNALPSTISACIHDMYSEQVSQQGSKIALYAADGRFSYTELDQLASRLAEYIRVVAGRDGRMGFIPLCFEKSKWAVVSMLAALKAGGAYVPLDPKHPVDRRAAIINDLETDLVLVSAEHAPLFNGGVEHVIVVDDTLARHLPPYDPAIKYPVAPSDPALVVFTSGSTGQPKGIVLEHAALCSGVEYHGSFLKLNTRTRAFQFTAFTFDVHFADIFFTLLRGGSVFMPSEHERVNNLAGAIRKARANYVYLTTTVASSLDPDEVRTLRALAVGGEAVTSQVVQVWAPRVRLINIYGPAEATVWCTGRSGCDPCDDPRDIGWGIGALMWIVDPNDHNKLAPIGSVGELLIEGPLLARKYLNNPSKTASVFIEDPKWSQDQRGQTRRFYKTGDLALFKSDGSVRFLGRSDTQVKLRGQRIEMGEIEQAISKCLINTSQCAVEIIKGAGNDAQMLAAFICLEGSDLELHGGDERFPIFAEHIRMAIAKTLPLYMVPTIMIPMEKLPMSVNGKLDRKNLRSYVSKLSMQELSTFASTTRASKGPETEMEKRLASIWKQVLALDHVGVNDNFISMGGDSIKVMRLVSTARAAGLSLSVEDVVKHPSLSEMASHTHVLEQNTIANVARFELVGGETAASPLLNAVSEATGFKRDHIEDIYPCTPLQRGLISLSTKTAGAYVCQTGYLLSESIDLDRFKSAWQFVVEAFPILRTRIVALPGDGLLQVLTREGLHWTYSNIPDGKPDPVRMLELRKSASDSRQALVNFAIFEGRDNEPRYFVWTIHHALYDAWTLSKIWSALHQAYHTGEVDAPSVPYQKYIKFLSSQATDESAANFWSGQLANPSCITFPAYPSAAYQPCVNAHENLVVRFNRKSGSNITTATIIRTAWALLVGQYSNSEDIIFGATLSGRNAPISGIEDIAGPTITTIPIRVRWNNNQTVPALLNDIQQQSAESIAFEHFGLQKINSLNRDCKAATDFHNLLIIQNIIEDNYQNPLPLTKFSDFMDGSQAYALNIECTITEVGVDLHAAYDEQVLESMQMTRILRQFEYLLRQLSLEDEHMIIDYAQSICPADYSELVSWAPKSPVTRNTCIHTLVGAHVLEQPSSLAVSAWDGDLTYLELDRLCTRLAHYLTSQGVKAGVFVPIAFEKSKWVVVSILAIWKSGGAFVLIDAKNPSHHLESILLQLDFTIVLASPQHVAKISTIAIVSNVLEVNSEAMKKLPSGEVSQTYPDIVPSDVAYVIFTSGSTGKPKGVIVEHRAISTNAPLAASRQGIEHNSRVLQFSSYTFDACIAEIVFTLSVGATVCIPSDGARMDDITGVMNEMRVTTAILTPAVLVTLDPNKLKTLKTVAVVGDKVPDDLFCKWADRVKLLAGYGPAECTVCSLAAEVTSDSKASMIGTPVACSTWIGRQNDPKKLAAIGTVGELLIGGSTLARGYLGEIEKTAVSFIDAPAWLPEQCHEQNIPSRLYRTGDLVRYDADGSILFVGRKDTQVKLRGQRIEFGEIEHQLRKCVKGKVAVEIISPLNSQPLLVAFITSNRLDVAKKVTFEPGQEFRLATTSELYSRAELNDLEQDLRQLLPSHMIPSLFLGLPALPLSASGKIDRKRLREACTGLTQRQLAGTMITEEFEPLTDMEELMHRLWRQVLSLDENETFDKQDSFFQLGGDSISAMKLSAAARELSVILSVDAVFKNPRLSHMALMLRAATLEEKGSPVLQPFELVSSWLDTNTLCNDISTEYPILIEAIEDVYPATPLQEAFLAIEVTDNSAYLFRYAWELPDDIDIPRFKAAWESTVQALPILRTRIVETKYQRPMQVVLRESLEWQDSGNLESYISNDRRKLATFGSPLAQYAIISNGENSKRHFVWTVHHATYDAVSLPLVLRHVKQAYFLEKPEPSTAFNSFIKYIESVKDSAVDFWRNELSNAPSVSFAHDLRPDHQLEVTSNFMCRVKFKSAARSDFTVATMLRASWAILLSRYSNSHDITFGATSNGRDVPVPGIDWIVGPTITTVPVRVKIDPDQPMDQFLKGIQSQATNTIPFQHLGLQNIKRIGQEVHAACEFQTLLIIQSPSQPAKENHEVFGKALQTFLPQAHTYPLVLEITPEKQALILQFSFDCKIISEKQIERLSGHFQQILKYFSHHDRMAPVKNIDMTTAADIQQIGRWNEPLLIQDEYCVQKCLQEALASHQDSQAIFAHDGEMSYSELDSLSSRLAQKLTYKGIGLHTNVLFSFERSSLAVVAILAIIKAGGILIPIELDCPKTILKHIIEHVDGRFIVCSASHRKLFSDSVEHILSVDATFYTIDDTPGKGFNTSQSHLQPTSNLYIIFETSLLEQPLGTIVEHRQYCTGFLERTKAMRDLATLRVLQGTLYSSSSGIREVLDTLMMGGCLCIPSDRDRLYNLGKYLNSAHVSVVELTPVLAEGISSEQAPDLQILSVTDLSSNAKLLNSWQSPVKLSTLHRFHGAPVTEFNRRHTAESTVSNNIGRPISALPWIVDTECPIRLAPLGTIGELVLEGPGIAAGYLDNAQKSEVAFYSRPPYIPHDSLPERRFFKTGELAKYNDFGEIILMNPKNAFPVSNGRKIDPSEIENRLRELIPSCSALAVDSLWSQGKDNLVAFVASGNSFGHPYGTTSTIIRFEEAIIDKSMISSLRQKLAHFVPAFMIPATFIPVDVLPVTIYGTLNRQQLRKLASTYLLEDPEKEPSLAALTTENERLMQELWSQTLGIEREKIQLEDQFTLLGGDSVASMRLVSAARARGLQLTTGDIFNNQSLRSMAAVARPLEAVISAHIPRFGLLGSHSQVCSIREAITAEYNFEDDLIEDIYPATPFQEDMLTNSLELPGLFTMRFVCSLAAFETDKFCRVWESRAAAHAILRTRIVQHDSKYYQVVLDNLVSWRSGDNLDAYLTEDAKKPVYLGGELSRVGIVREKDDATYFVWTAHHSVYDGWMCEMLMAEVEREYEQESIAEVGTDFQLFVKYTAELDVQQMSEYWLNKFKNCEPRRFCVVQEDYIPSMDGIFERHIQFDGTSRYGFTAASMMQLAWSYIVAQCSGSKDTVLELILTGRNSPVHGVQNIMAPTVATVPLRVTLDPKQSVYETLQKIESDQHEMAPYEQFGWPRIKELSATTKNVCECAAPFVVHPRPDDVVEKTWTTEMNLLDVIPIRPHAIPFQVDCHLGGDGFNAAARYDTKLFGKERVRELVDQFESVLRWIATADESAKIGQKSVNLI